MTTTDAVRQGEQRTEAVQQRVARIVEDVQTNLRRLNAALVAGLDPKGRSRNDDTDG